MILVIYDIKSDVVRFKVAEMLKDFGLERIQFSAFYGSICKAKLEELISELERKLSADDILHVFVLNGNVEKIRVLGAGSLPKEDEMIII